MRKTEDEYEIQGNYGFGYECVTTEVTHRLARSQIMCYRENEPNVSFRIIHKRVPIEVIA